MPQGHSESSAGTRHRPDSTPGLGATGKLSVMYFISFIQGLRLPCLSVQGTLFPKFCLVLTGEGHHEASG